MKYNPLTTGIIALVSPIPMILFTMFWGLTLCAVTLGFLNIDPMPDWLLWAALLPLLVSPAIGVVGIVQGIRRRTGLGILLSVLGLIENILLLLGIAYLGSRF